MCRIIFLTIYFIFMLNTELLANTVNAKLSNINTLIKFSENQRLNTSKNNDIRTSFTKVFNEIESVRISYQKKFKISGPDQEDAINRFYYLMEYLKDGPALDSKNPRKCSRAEFNLERDKSDTLEFKEALKWLETLCPK